MKYLARLNGSSGDRKRLQSLPQSAGTRALLCLLLVLMMAMFPSERSIAIESDMPTNTTPSPVVIRGAVALTVATVSVSQSAGTLKVNVVRLGDTQTTVQYATSNGTATAGVNYTATSGTLSWAAGDYTARSISIPISTSNLFTGSKTFNLTLQSPTNGAKLGNSTTAVTINGSGSSGSPGTLVLSSASYSISQSAGSTAYLTVTANRTGGSNGAVSVQYDTSNGTAIAGTNYTGMTGTLNWATGDATAKTFQVPISGSPSISGSRNFNIALASATGGATLGTPNTAVATINGLSSTSPSAVSALQLTNQGGSSNSLTNYQQFSWTAATPGTYPISYYKIYRNGVAYSTTTSTSYADSNAPGSNYPDFSLPATIYAYAVSAVDSEGNEGPKAYPIAFMFYGRTTVNGPTTDLSYGDVQPNYLNPYAGTSPGPYDISVAYGSGGGGWQPVTAPPMVPWNDLELGAFKYFTIEIMATSSQYLTLPLYTSMVSRVPPGDAFPWQEVNIWNYCTPAVNTWVTCKIPLSDMTIGQTSFVGSISGTTLKVTSVTSGVGVDVAGYVTGPGVPAGTYLTAHGQTGSVGTFTIAGPGITNSTNIGSETMSFQRTSVYKFFFQWECCTPPVTTFYSRNLGFTTN